MATRTLTLQPGVVTLVSDKTDWMVQPVTGVPILAGEATSAPAASALAHYLKKPMGFNKISGNCYAMPSGNIPAAIAVTESEE
jgi:hypothetical protein